MNAISGALPQMQQLTVALRFLNPHAEARSLQGGREVKETIADHCLPSLLKAWSADTQADIILN